MQKLSIVIPCYRSQHTIEAVVQEVRDTLKTRAFENYEIILVSDCSPDDVYSVIKAMAAGDRRIKGIELARNFGQHSALMAGFGHATGDVVLCLDDDGQTPANEMFSLLDKLAEGWDVVYALYPEIRQSLFRRMGSRLNKFMMEKLLGKPKGLVHNSYFACRRFVMDEILRYHSAYPYLGGLIFRTTQSIAAVPVTHRARAEGASGYTFGKLVSLWVNSITTFSAKPLRIATIMGFIVAMGGFAFLIYTVINFFLNPDIPLGYSSQMAAILFVGGMLMLMVGLAGEYIGRIYQSQNASPQYVIRSGVNLEEEKSGNEER